MSVKVAALDFKQLEGLRDTPDKLFDMLYRYTGDAKSQEDIRRALLKLTKKHGFDFGSSAIAALDADCSCWTVIEVMRSGFDVGKHQLDATLSLFEKIYEKSLNDGAAFTQYDYAAKLVKNQPRFAENLLNRLLQQDAPYICGHITELIRARIQNEEDKKFGQVLKLRNYASTNIQFALINILTGINYRAGRNKNLLTKAMAVLSELEDRNNALLFPAIAHGYGVLVSYAPSAQGKIKEYSSRGIPEIDYQLSRILFRQTQHKNDNWFNDLLLELGRTRCEYKGIIDNIDSTLFHMLSHNQDWERVRGGLRNWLVKSDFLASSQRVDEFFDSTISAYSRNTDKLQELITIFLNDDHPAVNKAAAQICSYFKSHGGKSLKLDIQVISALSFKDLQYIARRILGYVFDPDVTISMALSLLDMKAIPVNVRELAENMFIPHICSEYPEYCETVLKNALLLEKKKTKKAFISKILQQCRRVNTARDKLPRVKELRVSQKDAYTIALAEQKVKQSFQDKAHEKSIFAQIVTNIPLKYGVGFFSHHEGKFSDPTPLKSFSTSIPIPVSEVFAPIEGAQERLSFRRVKRER